MSEIANNQFRDNIIEILRKLQDDINYSNEIEYFDKVDVAIRNEEKTIFIPFIAIQKSVLVAIINKQEIVQTYTFNIPIQSYYVEKMLNDLIKYITNEFGIDDLYDCRMRY